MIFLITFSCLMARLLVNSRLVIVKFLGSQCYSWIFDLIGVGTPNPLIVQGSTVISFVSFYFLNVASRTFKNTYDSHYISIGWR